MQLANLLSASLALLSSLSLLVDGLMALVALGFIPGTHHVAFIRTFSLCAAALLLAYSGGHWHRVELARLGYAALGLLAAKLLFEDLRHGNLAFVAASLFLFALTLIAVPRIARLGQRR